MRRLFTALPLACGLFLLLCSAPGTTASPPNVDAADIAKQYNRLLSDYRLPKGSPKKNVKPWQVMNLINLICQLTSVPITDPHDLQKVHFSGSYRALDALEKAPDEAGREILSRWRHVLIQLDIKAHQVNNFAQRPSSMWVLEKGKTFSRTPSERMLRGYIEREKGTINITEDGLETAESGSGTEKLRYVMIWCLLPGVDDPETARARLLAFPPVRTNPRLFRYRQVMLQPESQLIRREYGIRPFPGYKGTMENYYRIAYSDPDRIVALEENTREGKFIQRTDNAGIYVKSPPHGVTVVLIFTGKYMMEEFFYVLAGDKLLKEPVEVMAILRQYILHPENGVDAAVEEGRKDYLLNQKAP